MESFVFTNEEIKKPLKLTYLFLSAAMTNTKPQKSM